MNGEPQDKIWAALVNIESALWAVFIAVCLLAIAVFLGGCSREPDQQLGPPDLHLNDGTPCWYIKQSHGHTGIKCTSVTEGQTE